MARTKNTQPQSDASLILHQARQGDVLLTRIGSIPVGAKERPRDKGRVILAYGEVTGHAHQIDTPSNVMLLDPPANDPAQGDGLTLAYLQVDALSQLVHEEHSTIPLPPGAYRVTTQREYSPSEIRSVRD